MNNSLMNLNDFCKKYKKIVCYGASDHGYMTKHFLNAMGVEVAFFIITDLIEDKKNRDGIPIYSVQDIKCVPKDYGIVLSLYERHHEAVLGNIEKYLKRIDGIYALKMFELRTIRSEVLRLERNQEFQKKVVGNTFFYEKKICELKKVYQKIRVQYIDVRRLGAYSLWGYYLYKRNLQKNSIFYLYYPVTHEHREEEHLKGSNGYLLSKLSAEGIEVISEYNIDFWRYFFKHHKEKFFFDNIYTEWGWGKELKEANGMEEISLPWIKLNQDEMHFGKKSLSKIGINKDFICVSARDNFYLQICKRDRLKEDFRDRYRNSDIKRQIKAFQYINGQNMQCVRMGVKAKKIENIECLIDYVNKGRTEFLDVFLASQCKFFVSDLSGIFILANMFGKNKVILNAPLLTTKGDSVPFLSPEKDIAILKKLWDIKKKRFLTLQEMLFFEIEMGNIEENIQGSVFNYYEKNGILPVENNEDEIFFAVKEMNERINGIRQYDDIDRQLQEKYRKIVDGYPKQDNFLNNWRLGAEFLRGNQWLLD